MSLEKWQCLIKHHEQRQSDKPMKEEEIKVFPSIGPDGHGSVIIVVRDGELASKRPPDCNEPTSDLLNEANQAIQKMILGG